MPSVLSALLGAISLSFMTTLYHHGVFPEVIRDGQYERIWFLHTIPTGALLGFGSRVALRTKPGFGRFLKCLATALLGIVPFGVWIWVYISADPIHALPITLQAAALFAPSLLWILGLILTGLAQLRPARFRSS